MIGYYVHHQGLGHLARARSVATAATEPVVALSSLPRPDDPAPFADWVQLSGDPHMEAPLDPTAQGTLHWSPLSAPEYRARMSELAAWLGRERPRLVVVDVSVEVAVLVRVLGTPAVLVALPGERSDPAHTLGHQLAEHIVAPWPGGLLRPLHLTPFSDKVTYVGGISRFDDRPASPPPGGRSVLVLFGRGGSAVSADDFDRAQDATPDWSWTTGPVADTEVWDLLGAADVVVGHAGLGAVGEIAAARRPAVTMAQKRPFAEQHHTAAALARAALAETPVTWPAPDAWPALLERTRSRSGEPWTRWNDRHGAARFAEVLASVGRR